MEETLKYTKKNKKIPEEKDLLEKYGIDIENYYQAKDHIINKVSLHK